MGFSLGKYFTEKGIDVSGFYSRNSDSSKEAAKFTKTKYYETLEEIIQNSDTLFLTVPDGSICEVYSEIIKSDINGKCLVHCSGAISSEVFFGISEKGAKGCSVHPICAVSDKFEGYKALSKAYFTAEGEAEGLVQLLRNCGNNVELISPESKVKYHASAVFASNLVIGLYNIATELLQECGLSESFSVNALKPLFLGNSERVVSDGAVNALTGPVERADDVTVGKHLALLDGDSMEIYRMLSRHLVDIAERKNPHRDYSGLYVILENSKCRNRRD